MNLRLARTPMFTLAAIALSGSIALAQQPAGPPDNTAPAAAPIERQSPPPPHGPGMSQTMRPGMGGGPRDRVRMDRVREFRGGDRGPMGGGFHIGPSGMWWKNPTVVQRLTLTADQTKKMDDIFQQSRLQLIDLKANVEKQQVMLEPLLSANPVDTAKAMTQIDKVAQSRADLEKADAKMLLGIRAVLTADQWTKLRDHQFGGPGGPGDQGGAGGPGGGGDRTRGVRGGGPSPNNSSNRVEPIDLP
ncbi:MAG: Spy/CpxP family protein refolding chaperone [Acidobacteriota bacterium]|nr:Spy/CpxP family protein refolding chaperone [Acidobacteriota bacterium]